MYIIVIKKQTEKSFVKMPGYIQDTFLELIGDLKIKGPVQPGWLNYSKLTENEYHCHLSRKWVAC